jgi:hypothetical protein
VVVWWQRVYIEWVSRVSRMYTQFMSNLIVKCPPSSSSSSVDSESNYGYRLTTTPAFTPASPGRGDRPVSPCCPRRGGWPTQGQSPLGLLCHLPRIHRLSTPFSGGQSQGYPRIPDARGATQDRCLERRYRSSNMHT